MSGLPWLMILSGTAASTAGLVQAELRENQESPLWALLIPAGLVLALAGVLAAAVPGFFTF